MYLHTQNTHIPIENVCNTHTLSLSLSLTQHTERQDLSLFLEGFSVILHDEKLSRCIKIHSLMVKKDERAVRTHLSLAQVFDSIDT